MDKRFLKNLLSRMSKHAFEDFVLSFFRDSHSQESFEPFPEIGEGVFCAELIDSYGGSIHALYIIHFLPMEIFNRPKEVLIADPTIIGKLKRIKNKYTGELGQWGMVSPHLVPGKKLNEVFFLNNLADIADSEYEKTILPRYKKLLKRFKLNPHIYGVGTCDTFVKRNPSGVRKVLKDLFSGKSKELCICLQEEQTRIERFTSEKNLFAGVSHYSKQPYEPIFINILRKKEEVLAEFESLVKKCAKESELEKFISAHYTDIFGSKYDRIETQLWLKFPELDIARRERRLDVFLRNSVRDDWELFEIKRPVKLTSTYRDVPVLAREVIHAIQQVKNYAKILSQDKVKNQLAKEGIQYYEPSLNLVIGRAPQIPMQQWRWLLHSNEKELKIFTFDELIKEMQQRTEDLQRIFAKLSNIQNH